MNTDPTPHHSLSPDVREKLFQLYKRYERFAWERGMADFRPLKPLILEMLSELATELTGQGKWRSWEACQQHQDTIKQLDPCCPICLLRDIERLKLQHAQELSSKDETIKEWQENAHKAFGKVGELSKELAKVREELAVANSQVENADINLEQVRITLESKHKATLSAVEAERDALKELWEDAPHGEGCKFVPPLLRTELQDCAGVCECTCWKSEVKLPTDSIEK